jgi:hypothetical protein
VTALWIGVVLWLLIGIPVAAVIGRAIALRDIDRALSSYAVEVPPESEAA